MSEHHGDLEQRLAKPGPAQRSLLEKRLLERRIAAARAEQIPRRQQFSPVPLSYSQELLWLLSQLESGVAYNAPAAFHLRGAIDARALQQALDSLVERHEILRTTYELVDAEPMQIVAPLGSVALELVDLSGADEQERERRLHELMRRESEHEFDLARDRVLRPWLIKLAEDEHVFFYVMHHVATDGYSRAVLHDDLTELYEAALAGREARLEPLPIQYADFSVWHRDWLDGGVLDQQLNVLAGDARPECRRGSSCRPTGRARRSGSTRATTRAACSRWSCELASSASRARRRATLFMALLSLYAVLLHRYSRQDDIVVGTPFAARNRREIEAMIGYFINPLALRLDVSGDPSFRRCCAGRARRSSAPSRTATCPTRRSCGRRRPSATSARRRCSR